jgi:hypothetical protein
MDDGERTVIDQDEDSHDIHEDIPLDTDSYEDRELCEHCERSEHISAYWETEL